MSLITEASPSGKVTSIMHRLFPFYIFLCFYFSLFFFVFFLFFFPFFLLLSYFSFSFISIHLDILEYHLGMECHGRVVVLLVLMVVRVTPLDTTPSPWSKQQAFTGIFVHWDIDGSGSVERHEAESICEARGLWLQRTESCAIDLCVASRRQQVAVTRLSPE